MTTVISITSILARSRTMPNRTVIAEQRKNLRDIVRQTYTASMYLDDPKELDSVVAEAIAALEQVRRNIDEITTRHRVNTDVVDGEGN